MGFRDLLPKTEKEVRKLREHDATMNGTPEDARNYDLIQRLNKLEKGQRGFTIDREAFRETLTDYGINRRVLFSPGCPHFVAVWEMRRFLNGMERPDRIKLLNPLAVRILQFRVEEDWFLLCRQKTTKADITGAIPNFSQSYLMATVQDLARNIVHVPANFPRDQLEILRGASVPTDTEGRHVERGLGALLPPGGTPPTFDSNVMESDEEVDPLRKRGWHDKVHPELQELTKKLREKKTPLNLNKGLKAANMTLADLPNIKCQDSSNPPRKGLCYKFLLGNCNAGEECKFCHVAPEDLSEEVMDALVPPMTKLVKEGLEKVKAARRKGKKRKRTAGPATVTFQE